MKLTLLLLAISGLLCNAKERPRILIKIVAVDIHDVQVPWTTPAIPGQSRTSCSGSADTVNSGPTSSTTGHANCTTTGSVGTTATTYVLSVARETVRAITLDDRHLVLQCVRCKPSIAGAYEGEVEGYTIWLYMPDLEGKQHKVKYRLVGTWKE